MAEKNQKIAAGGL